MQEFSSNVNLEEVELEFDEIEETQDIYDEVEYPCVILKGITIVQELEYLSGLKFDTKSSLPLYIEFEGSAKRLGNISLSVDGMLSLNAIMVDTYELELCKSKESKSKLDYLSGETLEKLIRLNQSMEK